MDIHPPSDAVGKYIKCSILDREGLVGHFRGVDMVVHIAAWHGVHEARGWKSEYEFWDLNVTGTFNVFQASVRAKVGKVVYISSTSVEDREGFYGFTKRMAEAIAIEYAERHDLDVIILRPRAFIPHWNREIYSSFVEWAKWFWGGAVHVEDVTQSVIKSIDLLKNEKLEEALTLTVDGAYEYSDEDLGHWDEDGTGTTFNKHYAKYEQMAKNFGLDTTLKPSKMDISVTKKWLGYEPKYSMKNLLEELAQYGEEGPPGPND